MILLEAEASEITRMLFESSKKTKMFAQVSYFEDLIVAEKLYLSLDGNLLLATGNKPSAQQRAELDASSHSKAENNRSPAPQNVPAAMKESHSIANYKPELNLDIANTEQESETGALKYEIEPPGFNMIENSTHASDSYVVNEEYTIEWVNEIVEEKDDELISDFHNEKWATQPFGWDDGEIVDYLESEDEIKFEDIIVTQIKLDDIPEGVKTEDGKFRCSKCDDSKVFDKVFHLWRHSEKHRQKSSLCAYCGTNYKSELALRSHEKKCPAICKSNYQPLSTHGVRRRKNRYENVTIADIARASCATCGKDKFRSETEYYDHQNIHSGDQPYICSCGNSRTRHYYNFMSHRKKNGCPLEGSSYPEYAVNTIFELWTKRGREQYRRINGLPEEPEEEKKTPAPKKYPNGPTCEFCNKKFLRSSTLARHRAVAHLERKIPCPECNKLFATQTCLKKHVRTHLFVKKCHICGQTIKSSGFSAHMLNYHSGKTFQCDQCNYSTTKKLQFTAHKKSHVVQSKNVDLEKENCKARSSSRDSVEEADTTAVESADSDLDSMKEIFNDIEDILDVLR